MKFGDFVKLKRNMDMEMNKGRSRGKSNFGQLFDQKSTTGQTWFFCVILILISFVMYFALEFDFVL